MSFKKELHEHFKKFSASPFLFIGSGVSRRYLGAESWEELLKKYCNLIDENFTKLKSQADGDFPKVATLLAKKYSELWWDSEFKGKKDEIYADDLIKMDSPLKVEISDYIKHVHEQKKHEYSEEIELLKSSKIDGVITTNWDLFVESLFDDFSVFVGQDDLFSSRNHGIAEIYKIHGCSSKPNSLVLTENDYEEFRRKNPYLSSKLLTIFVEHPIIFLGYSLTDSHILEILEDIVQCIPESKMESLQENIIFVEWVPDIEEPILTDSIILKRLPVKLLRVSSYGDIFEVLSEIRRRIPAHIFRKIKDELYELVIKNDPKGQLYVKDSENLEDCVGTREFVVGYGAISYIKGGERTAAHGIVGIDRYHIARDVILENGNYEAGIIINEAFPKLLKGKTYVPIFKYLNEAGLILDNGNVLSDGLCSGLKTRIDNTIEKFKSPAFQSRANNTPEVQLGIKELYNETEFKVFLLLAAFVPVEKMNLEDLSDILKKHVYDNLTPHEASYFIKLICAYDILKFSKKYTCA